VENIFAAKQSDFVKAFHTIYHNAQYPSAIHFSTLNQERALQSTAVIAAVGG